VRVQGNLRSLSMFVVVLGITLAVFVHAPTVRADAIVIDAFAAPAAGANFISLDVGLLPFFVGAQPVVPSVIGEPSILGGDRDVTIEVVGPVDWKSAIGTVGSADEVLSVFTGGGSGSTVTLDYPSLLGANLTDLGTNNAFALAFNFVEPGNLNLRITVESGGNTAMFNSSAAGNIGESSTPFTYIVPFDAFDTVGPLASADSISIVFNDPVGGPLPNVDFELTSVAAVPEPSTLAMLWTVGVVSLLAVARRRREQ